MVLLYIICYFVFIVYNLFFIFRSLPHSHILLFRLPSLPYLHEVGARFEAQSQLLITCTELKQGFEAQSTIVDHLHAQCLKLEQGFEAQFAIVDHLHAQCLKVEQGFEASLSSAMIFSWVWVWVWLETVSQERVGKKKSSYRSRNRWWRQRIWGKFDS